MAGTPMFRHSRRKTRSYDLMRGLAAVLVCLVMGISSASAAQTTLTVIDADEYVGLARVTVVYADTGAAVASGLTDRLGAFSFSSDDGRDLQVTAHTETGYVGTSGIAPGGTPEISADQLAGGLDAVVYSGTSVTLTYRDGLGNPIAGASVSIVVWGTFAQAASGTTDGNGEVTFAIPEQRDYLATFWKSGYADGLQVADYQSSGPGPMGPSGGSDWPTFP